MGKDSDLVVNSLIKLLYDEDSLVPWKAADALGKLGKKSNKIPPLIEKWLKENQDAENIDDVIDALWEMVAID